MQGYTSPGGPWVQAASPGQRPPGNFWPEWPLCHPHVDRGSELWAAIIDMRQAGPRSCGRRPSAVSAAAVNSWPPLVWGGGLRRSDRSWRSSLRCEPRWRPCTTWHARPGSANTLTGGSARLARDRRSPISSRPSRLTQRAVSAWRQPV